MPICCATLIISSLLKPINGLRIGMLDASSMTVMFSRVWELTCPKLSPVTSAIEDCVLANCSAILIINLLYSIILYGGGVDTMMCFCISPNGTNNRVDLY